MEKQYGQRAREANKNLNQDFKAISHGARVMIQTKELLSTGKVTIPHTGQNKELLLDLKMGKYNYDKWSKILERLLEEVESLKDDNSVLPKLIDNSFIDKLVIKLMLDNYNEKEIKTNQT